MKKRLVSAVVLVLVAVVAPLKTAAQALANLVPDDAMVYVGWTGINDMGPDYAGSRTKKMLDASKIRETLDQLWPIAMAKMDVRKREAEIFRDMLQKFGPTILENPTAFYIGPVDGLATGNPMPRVALLCKAGVKSAELKKEINDYIKQLLTNPLIPITAIEEDGVVAVTLGNVIPDLAGKTATTLSHRKQFTNAMTQVGTNPILTVYVDFEAITGLVDQVATVAPQMAGSWVMIRNSVGLGNLKRAVWTAGFSGQDFTTQGFVEAPAPREGILQLLDAGPLSNEALSAVPKSAVMMQAAKLDLAKLLSTFRTISGKINPQIPGSIDSGLALANMVVGLNLEEDFLKPMGDEWILYSSDNVGGVGPLGIVMVNHARDAAKLEKAMDVLAKIINSKIDEDHKSKKSGEPVPHLVQTKLDGLNVTFLNTPFISPSWTFKNGNMYVALLPQNVVAAAGTSAENSILKNEDFIAMRKRLGGKGETALGFYDLPRSAPVGYPYLMALSRVTGAAEMHGIQTPVMLLPPMDKVMPLMSVSGSSAWTDQTGTHWKTFTPFPMAEWCGGPEVILMQVQGFVLPMLGTYGARSKKAQIPQ